MLLNAGRGSGEVARQHAARLIASGNDVVFLHPHVGSGVEGATNMDVALPGAVTPVHEYLPAAGEAQKAVSKMSDDEALQYLPSYEGALESVVENLDIVIAHHGNLVAIAAARVCARFDKPFVIFLHGTGIEPRHEGGYDDRLWGEIEDAVKQAAGLIVTTEYVRDSLAQPLFDVDPNRYLVLPCGIDLHEFRPGLDGGATERFGLTEPYVICPGALTPVKGPQNVAAASRQYGDLAPTVFIGAGELESELRRDLADRGTLLGFVSRADKADLICNAALLVAAPVKREHFGIIYAEALAGGTPCVAYEGGGVDSIVTPKVGVLTPRDRGALGDAVRSLLLDHAKRARMASEARHRAEQRFDAVGLGAVLENWLSGLAVDGRGTDQLRS